MSEPKCNDRDVDAGLQQVHSGRMPDRMRRNRSFEQGRTLVCCCNCSDGYPFCNVRPLAHSSEQPRVGGPIEALRGEAGASGEKAFAASVPSD